MNKETEQWRQGKDEQMRESNFLVHSQTKKRRREYLKALSEPGQLRKGAMTRPNQNSAEALHGNTY